MTDTRTNQATSAITASAACLDDARTLLADMAENGLKSNLLEAARCSANVTLRYIQMLEDELRAPAPEPVDRYTQDRIASGLQDD